MQHRRVVVGQDEALRLALDVGKGTEPYDVYVLDEILDDDDKEVQVHRHLYILHSGGCTFSAKAIVVLSPGTTLSPPRVTPVWQDISAPDDEEEEPPY